MPTIRQIAKLAGVSTTAVWFALRNKPGVSKATRQRIRKLAEAYQYQIQPVLPPEFQSRCGTLAFITSSISTSMASRILQGIHALAFSESYHVVPLQLREIDISHIHLAIETVIEQKMQGLLLWGNLPAPVPAEALFDLMSHDLPVVCINVTPTERPVDHVTINHDRVGQLAVEYLHTLGHRQIAFLGGIPHEPRTEAFLKYVRQYGMTLQRIACPNFEEIDEVLTETYRSHPLPTAFLCHSDFWAVRTQQYLARCGWQVPEDISVLGCGNYPLLAGYAFPPLTSIEEFPEEIGRRAIALLIQRIREKAPLGQDDPRTELIEPRLEIRESCGPPRNRPLPR